MWQTQLFTGKIKIKTFICLPEKGHNSNLLVVIILLEV